MPNSEQIRYFWLNWIDRQYMMADPSHVKMRPEITKSPDDKGTADEFEALNQTRETNKIPPTISGSRRR
jgi:hypothetical protein